MKSKAELLWELFSLFAKKYKDTPVTLGLEEDGSCAITWWGNPPIASWNSFSEGIEWFKEN